MHLDFHEYLWSHDAGKACHTGEYITQLQIYNEYMCLFWVCTLFCMIYCLFFICSKSSTTRHWSLYITYGGIILPTLFRKLGWLIGSLCRLVRSLCWLDRSLCWLVTYSFVRNLIIKTCSYPVNTIQITTKLSDKSTSVSDKLT